MYLNVLINYFFFRVVLNLNVLVFYFNLDIKKIFNNNNENL